MHMMARQEGYLELSSDRILGTHEESQAKGTDCKRPSPSRDGVAPPPAQKPSAERGHKPHAPDQGYIVPHCRLLWITDSDSAAVQLYDW
jgi:hypothetical protein